MTRPSFEERWRSRFVQRGTHFADEAAIAGWSRAGLDARFKRFLDLWPGDAPGSLWVDAGCGAGTYARHLLDGGLRVVALDYSSPSLAKARQRAGGRGLWVAGDLGRLPLRSGVADGVLCFGVMQTLERPGPALESLFSVLRPGGVLWVDALNRWCLPNALVTLKRWLLREPQHLRYDGPRALRRQVIEAGASGVALHWLPLMPASLARGRWLLEHPALRWAFRHIPLMGLLLSHSFVLVAYRCDSPDQGAE